MENLFKNGVTVRRFTEYVAPSVLTVIIISLYSIIDGIFVANFVGSNALASINVVLPILGLLSGVSVMLSSGSSAIIAINMGEGNQKEANQKFTFTFIITIIISFILLTAILFTFRHLLFLIGATPNIFDYCIQYGLLILLASPFMFLGIFLEYFIRLDGKPGFALFTSISGGFVNIFFDILLVCLLDMGVVGAGISTLIGLCVSCFLGFWYFLKKSSHIKFTPPSWNFRFLGSSLINGSSEMVSESSVNVTTILLNIVILKVAGEDGIAAFSVILYLLSLLESLQSGFVVGVSPLISYYYGSKNYTLVNTLLVYSRNFIIVSSLSTFMLSQCFAPQLTQILLEPDTHAYQLALEGLRIGGISFLFLGINIFASGMFTAYANGKISAVISLSQSLIMIIIGLIILPPVFGLNGIWMVYPFAEIATVIPTLILIHLYKIKYHYNWLI